MKLLSKPIYWSNDKNETIKLEREVSFEDIVSAISEGGLLKITDHPNPIKYPNQQIMIVEIDNYAYVVPFVEDSEKYFLKTIFPSREATKLYIINNK